MNIFPPPPLAYTEWPTQELEFLQRCPVCNGTDRQAMHLNLYDRFFHCAPGQWTLYGCNHCGTGYLDPRPNAASISKAYATYCTHDGAQEQANRAPHQPGGIPTTKGTPRHFLRAILNSYRNHFWGMALSPGNSWGHRVVALVPALRNLVQHQMRHLPERPPRPGARLLDVGSGSGGYLSLAKAAGWAVVGVDFDPKAIEAARHKGIDVHFGSVEDLPASIGKFERITCSHVLEHVHDPKAWLKAMHSLLAPGGTLWLQTPNINSVGHSLYGSWWRGLEPPRHLSLLNLDTLSSLLTELGFAVQFIKLPVATAMHVYAVSEASRQGDVNAAYLPIRKGFNPRFIFPALKQTYSLKRAEFLTVVAVRHA